MDGLSPRQLAERLGISERRLRRLLKRHGDRIPHQRTGRSLRFPPEAEAALVALLPASTSLPPAVIAPAAEATEERRLLTDLIHTQARVMERLAAALEQRPTSFAQEQLPAPAHDLEARVQSLAHELARQGERIHFLERELREAIAALREDMEKCQFWSKRLMLHLASKNPPTS